MRILVFILLFSYKIAAQLPASGQITLSAIGTEALGTSTNVSLRNCSSTAGFTIPDAMTEFYGWSASYDVEYLVVGGGGGGGSGCANIAMFEVYGEGGGGGAGGSFTATVEYDKGDVLTLVVGAGGATYTNGSNSSIQLNSDPADVATGGGRGGNSASCVGGAAGNGGCGGGAYAVDHSEFGPTCGAAGTAVDLTKGNNGNACVGALAGAGGNGAVTSWHGGTYAIGGPRDSQASGAANTGNGGGGGRSITGQHTGGAGGSGVVILRMLTSDYSGITTGSPTVTTDGSYTVVKYTSNGTYTL